MLQLVGQHVQVLPAPHRQGGYVDVNALPLVTVGVNLPGMFVRGAEVAAHALQPGVDDV